LEAAKRNLDAQLWDTAGQYYRIDTQSDYPAAVFSDALCGQRYCEEYGLPNILPRWKMTLHFQKVYDVCVTPNPNFGAKLGRMPDTTDVPSGDRETYEYWVGTTYFLAALMFRSGMKNEALSTAYGAYYPVYEADNLAYWFNTPEAWRDEGINPRPAIATDRKSDHYSDDLRSYSEEDDGTTPLRAYPHQYQRARAVWELMFEIQRDSTFYQCGDANGDGTIDVSDVVYLVNYLFKEGDPPDPLEAGETNCDGLIDVGDVVYIINYLYKDGTLPSC
jgi:hypothetical protein